MVFIKQIFPHLRAIKINQKKAVVEISSHCLHGVRAASIEGRRKTTGIVNGSPFDWEEVQINGRWISEDDIAEGGVAPGSIEIELGVFLAPIPDGYRVGFDPNWIIKNRKPPIPEGSVDISAAFGHDKSSEFLDYKFQVIGPFPWEGDK